LSLLQLITQSSYHQSKKALKQDQYDSWIFLIGPVSVIDYCDLGFICYLVFVIWNLTGIREYSIFNLQYSVIS